MTLSHLKTAPGHPPNAAADIADTVQIMLARMRTGGAQVALEYARSLDGWTGEIAVPSERIAQAIAGVPQDLRDDIRWAHDNLSRFAAAQRVTAQDMEVELRPGLIAGQRQIPLSAAGCYVPGGRYTHIASALMSIATAREAGVVPSRLFPVLLAATVLLGLLLLLHHQLVEVCGCLMQISQLGPERELLSHIPGVLSFQGLGSLRFQGSGF